MLRGVTLPVASVSPTRNGSATLRFTTSGVVGLGAIQVTGAEAQDLGSLNIASGAVSATVYKGSCPITATGALAVLNTDYSITSGTLTNSASNTVIKFLVPGNYTILLTTSNNAQGAFSFGQ